MPYLESALSAGRRQSGKHVTEKAGYRNRGRRRAELAQRLRSERHEVGERRDDPLELLLLGDDGQHYAYPLPDGPAWPVEPDAGWAVDRALPPMEELLA